MKRTQLFFFNIFLFAIVFLSSCSQNSIFKKASVKKAVSKENVPEFVVADTTIKFSLDEETKVALNAKVYRPVHRVDPKTIIIFAPGSGNVSKDGEVTGDGIDLYENGINQTEVWSKALAKTGYFVLAYDKRTCSKRFDDGCQNIPQKDVEEKGILALAQDLDQVCQFVSKKVKKDQEAIRLILMSSTQGAQVIASSNCLSQASGVVLFSPVYGDLSAIWSEGLILAADHTENMSKKTRLVNRAESTRAFFTSLKGGQFPENAKIRGASAAFWHSWLDASAQTIENVNKASIKSAWIFSEKDYFAKTNQQKSLKKIAAENKNFLIKRVKTSDRNFLVDQDVDKNVLNFVAKFVESTGAKI